MPFQRVDPVFDPSVRGLCVRPYPGHKKGCPNFDKKKGCPPGAPLLPDAFDMDDPFWVVWNVFDLRSHTERLRVRHPQWSWRQLSCCLYWQGTARKSLKDEIAAFLKETHRVNPELSAGALRVESCPEAMGLNVTATMASIGLHLEWPPELRTVQVALVGTRKQVVS